MRREVDAAMRATTEKLSRMTDLLAAVSAPPLHTATIKHIELVHEWNWTKAEWPRIKNVIRYGLPESIRDTAELDLPDDALKHLYGTASIGPVPVHETGEEHAYLTP